MPPYLALLSTLICSNYPCFELIFMVQKGVRATEEGVYNSYTVVCPPERVKIYSLHLVDYLLVQADKPWYNDYITKTFKYIRRQVNGNAIRERYFVIFILSPLFMGVDSLSI